MTPDAVAQLVLIAYALVAAGGVWWQIRRSCCGWRLWSLYCVERTYVGLMFRWRSRNRTTLPAEGPALIYANHRSPVDPLMIWMHHNLGDRRRQIRKISFMMAREFYEVFGVHWMSSTMDCITVERKGRDTAPVRQALRKLRNGDMVCVFPEGRINHEGMDLLEAGTGIAWLAIKSRAPVIPVFIENSPQGDTMVAPFCTHCQVSVRFGAPIDLGEHHNRKTTPELLQQITDRLMLRLAKLGEVSYGQSDGPATLPIPRQTG